MPNVYLFVLDEYGGFQSLKNYFNFDNESFKDSLEKKKFFIAKKPSSNYNLTWLSCLSMLEMSYVSNQNSDDFRNKNIYGKAAKAITENNVVRFFESNDYKIVNNTFFKLENTKSNPFLILPVEQRLITDKTFGKYLSLSLLNNIPSNQIQRFLNTRMAMFFAYNENVINSTYSEIKNSNEPVFMYSHFLLPHTPYLKTKDGETRKFSDAYQEERKSAPESYINYLQYANNELLNMVSQIQNISKNSIIIITSDHGNRFVRNRNREKDFDNFLAIYTPDQNYEGFNDSTCTVNLFRILLNSQFNQSLPILECQSFDVAKGHL
jgi:hypothetical protein